jgi:hypothetical protein
MDHDLSLKTKAAERYLLGELPPEEREAFEEHYFECVECAEEVRIGQEFAANAAAVFREQSSPVATTARKQERTNWFSWFRLMMLAEAAACLVLAALVGYQNTVVIPGLRALATSRFAKGHSLISSPGSAGPELLASALLAPSSRGNPRPVSIPAGARFFHLALDLGPAPSFPKYACDLRSSSGASLWNVPLPTLDPDAGIHLLVPAKAFPPGSYDAVLLGIGKGETRELDHYYFDVRRP